MAYWKAFKVVQYTPLIPPTSEKLSGQLKTFLTGLPVKDRKIILKDQYFRKNSFLQLTGHAKR